MRSNMIKRNFCRESFSNPRKLPDDFFYKFMRKLPYKLNDKQESPKRLHIEVHPSHTHRSTPFEEMQQSSPSTKLKMLQAARAASRSVAVSPNEHANSTISSKIIKSAAQLQKENSGIKKQSSYFFKKVCSSKKEIQKKLRIGNDWNLLIEKAQAAQDYYKVRKVIDTFGKSKVLEHITRRRFKIK